MTPSTTPTATEEVFSVINVNSGVSPFKYLSFNNVVAINLTVAMSIIGFELSSLTIFPFSSFLNILPSIGTSISNFFCFPCVPICTTS